MKKSILLIWLLGGVCFFFSSLKAQPIPYLEVTKVEQLTFGSPYYGGLSNVGRITMKYFLPPGAAQKVVNILYSPYLSGPPATHWICKNVIIEPFGDTMEISYRFGLDPEGQNDNPILPILDADIYTEVTDSVFTQSPVPSGPPEYKFLTQTFRADANNPIDSAILAAMDSLAHFLPPIPHHNWDHPGSQGVLIGCEMPNIDLDSSVYKPGKPNQPYVPNHYAGDWNACAPAATGNSFSWLRTKHADIDSILTRYFGVGDTAQRKILAEFSSLMERTNESGANLRQIVRGKLSFIDKYKLPIRVGFQAMGVDDSVCVPSPNTLSRNIACCHSTPQEERRIDLSWLYNQMKKGADVEALFAWIPGDPNSNKPVGGHAAVLSGMRTQQNSDDGRLKIKDDGDPAGPGGMVQEILDMVTTYDPLDLAKLVPGPISIPQWTKWDGPDSIPCYLVALVAECYDSTIVHTATVSGRVFEDLNEDGIEDTTEIGISGWKVYLKDAYGIVDSTVTDASGNYVFDPICRGNHHVVFDSIPGFRFSPKDQGGDDSKDSDANPGTGATDVWTLYNRDTLLAVNAGIIPPRRIKLDLKVILSGTYRTSDSMMLGLLRYHNFVGWRTEPYSSTNFTVTHGQGMAMSAAVFAKEPPDPQTPIDWVLVELRDPNNPQLLVASKPALVLANGCVVHGDGTPFCIDSIGKGNYHVAIRHRNHLGVMTAQPQVLSAFGSSIDFTDANTPVYGTDNRVLLAAGEKGLRPGNADRTGTSTTSIDAADRSRAQNDTNSIGFIGSDVDLDGNIDADDRVIIQNNSNHVEQIP